MGEIARQNALCCVYDPKSLKAMGMAFDPSVDALPQKGRGDTRLRQELALRIIYLTNSGETDPRRVSHLALLTVMKPGENSS